MIVGMPTHRQTRDLMKQIRDTCFTDLKFYLLFPNTRKPIETSIEKGHTREKDQQEYDLVPSSFSFELDDIYDLTEDIRFGDPDQFRNNSEDDHPKK